MLVGVVWLQAHVPDMRLDGSAKLFTLADGLYLLFVKGSAHDEPNVAIVAHEALNASNRQGQCGR